MISEIPYGVARKRIKSEGDFVKSNSHTIQCHGDRPYSMHCSPYAIFHRLIDVDRSDELVVK